MGDMDSAPGFVSQVWCVTLGKSCDLSSSLWSPTAAGPPEQGHPLLPPVWEGASLPRMIAHDSDMNVLGF